MYQEYPYFIQDGWRCPQCQKILSPHISFCPFCGGNQKTWTFPTTTGIPNDNEWWQKYLKQSQTGRPTNDNPSTTTATTTSSPNVRVTAWNSTTTCEQKCEDCDKYEKSCFNGIETISNNTIISHKKPLETYYAYDFLDSFIKHFQD